MKQIYLHGLGQNPDSWSKVIEQLENAEHSMCPDLSELVQGHDTTYQNLYAAFSAMCDEIEEDICLCGLSLGGVLALNYAIEHPKKIKGLVLIATQYKMRYFGLCQNLCFNKRGLENQIFSNYVIQ